jgi:hypothetical protein
VFNNNTQGSPLTGRPKKMVELCTKQTLINAKLQIGNRGKKRSWLGEIH